MGIKLLDCTIRDGGHLNSWHFDETTVKAAYFAALNSGVDYFEAGYRFPRSKKGLGDFGYCDDELLYRLLKPVDHCKITIMTDVGKTEKDDVRRYDSSRTPVRGIRVAAYPYEYTKAFELIEDFKEKGYEVFLQLMAFSSIEPHQYKQIKSWNNKNIIEAIYFADSFGSFIPSDIEKYYEQLKSIGFARVGYHAHNSLQLAFANALKAMEIGVEFIDASIYGMGRGAGNLPIEIIIGYLEKCGQKKYNIVPYLNVINKYIDKYYKKIRWGYTLDSLMGGFANIHPYYSQTLLENGIYTVDEVWNALQIIKERCPISFSEEKMHKTLDERFYTPLTEEKAREICINISNEIHTVPAPDAVKTDTFSLKNKFKGRTFLIISTGPSILDHQEEINAFIKSSNCIVIGINNLNQIFTPDFHIFISRKRFEQYASTVSSESILLLPSYFGKSMVEEKTSNKVEYFQVIAPCGSELPIENDILYCESLNVSVSAILLAYLMGASDIHNVGMDGYIDEYNKQMVYFYNENNKIDDKETASMRYEMLAKELERVSVFLRDMSVPFFIRTPTSHKKYYRPF